MKQKNKVSIIMQSYNHAKYIRQSIESVLGQTFTDFEFIIIDDASTDESWSIINDYSDPRIRAYRNEMSKRVENTRWAISELAVGEYIAIQHSDDVWEMNKLEKQVTFLDSQPNIGAVFTWAHIIDDDGHPFQNEDHFYSHIFEQSNRTRHEWLNHFFYHGNALCHPSVLIRKQCYKDVGLYRHGFGQLPDFDMWVRLCLKYEIHVMPEKLVRFRVHLSEMNTSGNRPEVRIRGQLEYLHVLNNYRKIENFDELVKVFPVAEKYAKPEDDLDFVLGMVAHETKPYKFTELFGLNILFEIFSDEHRMEKIKRIYGFSQNNFISLTGKHDVFSTILVEDLKNQLVDMERQFAERERQAAELEAIKNSVYWKIILIFQKGREMFIPHGSRRERLIFLILEAYSVLKNEGVRSLLRIIYRKILRPRIFGLKPFEQEQGIKSMISIVIPVFNAVSFTESCIEQIYKINTTVPFEVIVVDNCSKDGTKRLLKKEQKRRQNFKSFRMPNNAGFGGAVNHGCRQAKGNIVVILNNDTLVTSGWLEKLIEPFQKDESIGIVSPVTNYVGEGPQIDPDAVNISPDAIEAYAKKIKDREHIHEPNRLVFFCVAIKRTVLDIVGDLDIGYEKGNYEDDDYCMRTITAGFRLAIAQGAFVYHFGTMTFKKNKISHNEYMERNRKRFYRKAQNIAVVLRPSIRYEATVQASVIVRTLNRPELMKRALTSLSNQTFKDFEVVVVNDGGEDISSMLETFEEYFPINHIYHHTSKGRTAALNIGLKNSRGKWVAFLDDDDIVYPWHLDTLVSNAKQHSGFNVFYSDYNRSLFASKQEKYPQITTGVEPWSYDPQKLLVRNHMPIHTWLISQDCIKMVGGFDENQEMLEDYEFLIRLSKVFDFLHVARFTCEYRFYLDGMNSMVTQRKKTLDALRTIYDRHPVTSPKLINARKVELASLKTQVEAIKNLQSTLTENSSNEAKVNREIIQLITGI